MKTSPKLILLLHKTTTSHHSWLLIFIIFFILTFTYTLTTPKTTPNTTPPKQYSKLPKHIQTSLLHYATITTNSTTSSHMFISELKSISTVLQHCTTPCNFLIFGITHETLLWHSLNNNGRTVFIDERSHIVSKLETEHPYIEAYDMHYTTEVSELYELMEHYKEEVKGECRPVQNLLFSECKLAVNDLPNHVYEVDWDVILIDGPKGYFGNAPGRMMSIFSASVLARSRKVIKETHVFVHEIGREVEKVCSEEFLCKENLVEVKEKLGHFVVGKWEKSGNRFGFCSVADAGKNQWGAQYTHKKT